MNVFVRVDVSEKIGTGHFFRCLTLSLKLISKGHLVTFVSRQMPVDLIKTLDNLKINFLSIYTNSLSKNGYLAHSHWLGIDQLEDANNFKNAIGNEIDLIIIDHYGIDYVWELELKNHTKEILVIDDLADRNHVCDYILDQNYYPNFLTRYDKKVPESSVKLLGPDYCLLRDDFLKRRKINLNVNGNIDRVFIFFGGIDYENYTKVALDAVKKLNVNHLIFDVVVGNQNPNKNYIKALCNDFGYNYYCQISNIAEIMSKADLAIGAGGSTSWERCCLGLPSVVVPIAENQIAIAHSIDSFGAAICIDNPKNLCESVYKAIHSLQSDPSRILSMSESCMKLVDGLGTKRVLIELGA